MAVLVHHFVQIFMAVHLVDFEMFQSGPDIHHTQMMYPNDFSGARTFPQAPP